MTQIAIEICVSVRSCTLPGLIFRRPLDENKRDFRICARYPSRLWSSLTTALWIQNVFWWRDTAVSEEQVLTQTIFIIRFSKIRIPGECNHNTKTQWVWSWDKIYFSFSTVRRTNKRVVLLPIKPFKWLEQKKVLQYTCSAWASLRWIFEISVSN